MENYSGAISKIGAFYKKGIRPGTEVTRAILDGLGSPDKVLKIIHVAGTNGKGSVCEYLTHILISAGKNVGTFTSPAVYDYSEQFRVNGVCIDTERLERYLNDALTAAAKAKVDATGFEIEVAAALHAFVTEGCEYAVVECGMGGKDDATNAIAKKEIAVITSIGLEHTAFLGNTLQSICEHKTGIIKNCPSVASALQNAESAAYLGGKGVIFADKPIEVITKSLNGQTFTYGGFGFFTQMLGEAQLYNAASAIEAARLLNMPFSAIYMGVKSAKLGGRVEVLKANGITYILDGAHNPSAFSSLCEVLDVVGGADFAVYGSLSDKDIQKNILNLKGRVGKIYAVTPDGGRAMPADKVVGECARQGVPAEKFESISAALLKASGKIVVVCGTFTILKEAKQWIEKRL